MSDDIVAQLRNLSTCDDDWNYVVAHEAADEIERLQRLVSSQSQSIVELEGENFRVSEIIRAVPSAAPGKYDGLIERLKSHAADISNFNGQAMANWDKWRVMIEEDDGSSEPRECYEAWISSYADEMQAAADALDAMQEQVKKLKRESADEMDYCSRRIAIAIEDLFIADDRIAVLEEALRKAQVELREIGHNAADPFESDEDYTENFPAIAERAFKAASAIDAALEEK